MAQCVTCGSELHPDRAKKYDYCLAPECQEKNLKGLAMVAIGVNKSAEQYLLLDDQTRAELASGKFADRRRGSFGTSASPASSPAAPAVRPSRPQPARSQPARPQLARSQPVRPQLARSQPARPQLARSQPAQSQPARPQPARRRPAPPRPAGSRVPRPWTRSQERLALLYNEQGLRPEEIAGKLGLSTYTVTQIILGSRNRGKL